jgi:hypothetical protein
MVMEWRFPLDFASLLGTPTRFLDVGLCVPSYILPYLTPNPQYAIRNDMSKDPLDYARTLGLSLPIRDIQRLEDEAASQKPPMAFRQYLRHKLGCAPARIGAPVKDAAEPHKRARVRLRA